MIGQTLRHYYITHARTSVVKTENRNSKYQSRRRMDQSLRPLAPPTRELPRQ